MNKHELVKQILAQLTADVELYARAARAAHSEATDEQSKAENKYDTRGLEASYLARGQYRQAAEAQEALRHFESLVVRSFGPNDPIDLTALVELEGKRERNFYFIAPRAGGTEVVYQDKEVLVINPHSPLCRQLMGKKQGDVLQIAIGGQRNQYRVASVL